MTIYTIIARVTTYAYVAFIDAYIPTAIYFKFFCHYRLHRPRQDLISFLPPHLSADVHQNATAVVLLKIECGLEILWQGFKAVDVFHHVQTMLIPLP